MNTWGELNNAIWEERENSERWNKVEAYYSRYLYTIFTYFK